MNNDVMHIKLNDTSLNKLKNYQYILKLKDELSQYSRSDLQKIYKLLDSVSLDENKLIVNRYLINNKMKDIYTNYQTIDNFTYNSMHLLDYVNYNLYDKTEVILRTPNTHDYLWFNEWVYIMLKLTFEFYFKGEISDEL